MITPDEPADAPLVVRVPQPAKPAAVKVPPLSMEGSFVEFVCQEKGLKIVVQTSQGKKTFLIEDPNKIAVAGHGTGKLELNCGAQKPAAVKIEYSPATQTGVDGLLKGIYFQ